MHGKANMQTVCQLILLLAVLAACGTAAGVMISLISKEQVARAVKKLVLIAVCLWLAIWAAGSLLHNYIAPLLTHTFGLRGSFSTWLVPAVIVLALVVIVAYALHRTRTS